jgi:hypothetical protein
MFCKAKRNDQNRVRQISEPDARWLALLIETEGNICIRRHTQNRKQPQHAIQVGIANSDKTILEYAKFVAKSKGSILTRSGTNRDVYYLQWTTKEAAKILWEVYPYLFGKKNQARCALYLESRRDNKNKGKRSDIYKKNGRHYSLTQKELDLREKLWIAIKSLNQHKTIDISWVPDPPENKDKWGPCNQYWWDQEAIREPATDPEYRTTGRQRPNGTKGVGLKGFEIRGGIDHIQPNTSRNKRTVWSLSSQSFPGAHFAVMPEALVEPCLLAGCPAQVCAECGQPWVRVVEREPVPRDLTSHRGESNWAIGAKKRNDIDLTRSGQEAAKWKLENPDKFLGFAPTCQCCPLPAAKQATRPGVALDPFFGAGTVGVVAKKFKRNYVGIELNPDYAEMARKRLDQTQPALFAR